MRIFSWIELAVLMAAPLVASAPINSASPGPELARSTDCGPGNQVIPEGHTLTHRSLDGVDVSRLTQCEAQAKVKELDAQSDQLDFDLLETYRRKVFAKGLRMHYDHAQGTILADNHWYEALSNPNISERGKQKIYAATWHRANKYMNDNHDISFEVKSCLNAWTRELGGYEPMKSQRADKPEPENRKVYEAVVYNTRMRQLWEEGKNIVCT